MAVAVQDDALLALEGFAGMLLRPGDGGYDETRQVHNGMIDKRPALIARCNGVADVVAAVNFGREQGLEISIRGGGHNVGGTAVADDALMIDLAGMKGIHVDPATETVRAQSGVTWAELNRETQLHGLGVTGGAISSTGIAGLTLGAGLGWTMGKFGLAADNLLSAQVVTADGRVITASEQEHPDLFWALRGGGGNFGVVTSFEYRLHQLGPIVRGGLIAHPFEAAGDLLRFYRAFTQGDVPDELTVFAGLVHAPDGSGTKLSAFAVCHVGSPEQADRDLAPLLEWGSPLEVQVGPMPYSAVNQMLDEGYPRGAHFYWKSSFVNDLTDATFDTMIERFATTPSPMNAILFEHFHGAVTRVPVAATACQHREVGWNLLLPTTWLDRADTEANISWTRETYDALSPAFADRRWLNYLVVEGENDDQTREVYGPNYDRLVEVKNAYDPQNLFHLNLNIRPSM